MKKARTTIEKMLNFMHKKKQKFKKFLHNAKFKILLYLANFKALKKTVRLQKKNI